MTSSASLGSTTKRLTEMWQTCSTPVSPRRMMKVKKSRQRSSRPDHRLASQKSGWGDYESNGRFATNGQASFPLLKGAPRDRWSLLYLTVRDQILSPVIQGAVFAVGGIALGHVRAFIVARRQMASEQRKQAFPSSSSTPAFLRGSFR